MDPWLLWLIAAVLLGLGEIATGGLLLAPFAGGALASTLAAGAGSSALGQWAVFVVVSVVLLAALRPVARRQRYQPPQLRTGSAALIGTSATVLGRVTCDDGTIRLNGEVWTARPYDDDEAYEPGARVQVIEIRGATAVVSD